jgi:hypothetical protein
MCCPSFKEVQLCLFYNKTCFIFEFHQPCLDLKKMAAESNSLCLVYIICVNLKIFLLVYVCCTGGIHSDNSKYRTLVRSPPRSLPLSLLPTTLKAIARGFFVLFPIGIWNLSTTYTYLNFLHSPSPPKYPHTYIYTVLTL